MKDYTKEAYLKLSRERQVKVSLDLIYLVEESWAVDKKRSLLVEKLKDHLEWLSIEKDLSHLKPLALRASLDDEISLRKILNIAMAFERNLSLSLKDESILVSSKDSKTSKAQDLSPLSLVLDNLRSAHNVGSIFRTAECLGIKHIYLVGYTATPQDKAVKKTAMGADESVSWSHVERLEDLIQNLKKEGVELIALETAENAKSLYKSGVKPKSALFLGNERFGLESKHLKLMDLVLKIPMKGRKNSLNVSNACAIATYEIISAWNH